MIFTVYVRDAGSAATPMIPTFPSNRHPESDGAETSARAPYFTFRNFRFWNSHPDLDRVEIDDGEDRRSRGYRLARDRLFAY